MDKEEVSIWSILLISLVALVWVVVIGILPFIIGWGIPSRVFFQSLSLLYLSYLGVIGGTKLILVWDIDGV